MIAPIGPDFRFSASGVKLGARCARAWAYRYIDGIKSPEVTWAEIEAGADVPSRLRSLALGTEVHNALERWYLSKPYDWSTLPGQIAQSGKHLLPSPDVCNSKGNWREIEGALPPLTLGDVNWSGRMDLLVCAPSEFRRLEIEPFEQMLLIDFKTSSNIPRYALTADELLVDLQSNLYALAVMARESMPRLSARWVYVETKKTRKAKAVDVTIERDNAEQIVGRAAEVARSLRVLPSSDAAPCNTNACYDYGGCEFRKDLGGPCDAKKSLGAKIQSRTKGFITNERKSTMPLPDDVAARLAKFKPPAASAPEAEETPAPAPAPKAASTAGKSAQPAKRGRGRPKKNADAPKKPAATAPATGGKSTILAGLVTQLAEAEQALADAQAAAIAAEEVLDEINEKLREALA